MELIELGRWAPQVSPRFTPAAFAALSQRVEKAYETTTVYPPREQLFAAFSMTPPEQVRVVILGQDPYHGAGQAHGLAFSVSPGVKPPPSLVNIYKELQSDLGIPPRSDGCLTDWAAQGVFLLNTVLTVEAGKANSHSKLGWQAFTDAVVASIAALPQPVAFLLWGAQAQKKAAQAAQSPYPRLVLTAPHPSPLSAYRGFFGSRPFSQINRFLESHGEAAILWLALSQQRPPRPGGIFYGWG